MTRRLKEDSILYISKYDKDASPGIRKKIAATLRAAEQLGFRTRNLNEEHPGMLRYRHIVREIVTSPEKYLFIRSFAESNLFLLPSLILARLQGKIIILDVPTPFRFAAAEIWRQPSAVASRIYRVILLYLSGPYSMWPATRVIQYAAESTWFSLGNRRRTIKLGNGIDLEQVPLRRSAPAWPSGELRLVAVATVSYWHGFDRLLRAICEWNSSSDVPYVVRLTVIGDGRALDGLRALAASLKLGDSIEFTGMLGQDDISRYYEQAHLAIGSLGLHRSGLTESSQLKAREYCAAGIPFIAGGPDADFANHPAFRFEVSLSEDTEDLKDAFRQFGRSDDFPTPAQIRRFAEDNLSYLSKLRRLGVLEHV